MQQTRVSCGSILKPNNKALAKLWLWLKGLSKRQWRITELHARSIFFYFPDFAFYMLTLIWMSWCLVVQTNPLTICNHSKNKHTKPIEKRWFPWDSSCLLETYKPKRYYSICIHSFIHSVNMYWLITMSQALFQV